MVEINHLKHQHKAGNCHFKVCESEKFIEGVCSVNCRALELLYLFRFKNSLLWASQMTNLTLRKMLITIINDNQTFYVWIWDGRPFITVRMQPPGFVLLTKQVDLPRTSKVIRFSNAKVSVVLLFFNELKSS